MGQSVIAVPIHLDALYVSHLGAVTPPMADFTRLPFFDGERDVNARTPWLGEAAASEPFDPSNLVLKPGIHLHWRFPKGLTTGIESGEGKIIFPHLPDRWLVTRGRKAENDWVMEDQWVVESNYLHPEDALTDANAYPLATAGSGRCYRHMGRALPLEQWRRHDRRGVEYLDSPLTAAGYGEPTFASLYPNCRDQFGFHDPEYAQQIPTGLFYQVIGWYSTPRQDWLQYLMQQPFNHLPADTWRDRLARILKDRLRWSVQGSPTVDVALTCHASVVFEPKADPVWAPQLDTPVVTFGATMTEALSAYLASEVAAGDSAKKTQIEDQLEAIMLDRALSTRSVDLASKFKEARHEKGFDEVYGGILWTVRAETAPGEQPDPNADAAAWPDVMENLELLNRLQNAYQIAWDEIQALRRRLYSDWCRYMRSSYPPDGANNYPKPFEVRSLIEQQLPELERKIADAGMLELAGRAADAPPSYSETKPFSVARQICELIGRMLVILRQHEQTSTRKTHFVIQPSVAPRYWRPTEPVILLTGKALRLDEHLHVEDFDSDGLLMCELLTPFADIERSLTVSPSTFVRRFSMKPRRWTEQPWHPLLLQWEVELTPFMRLANLTTPDRNYDQKFITRNFTLKRDDADLSPRTIAGETDGGPASEFAPGFLVHKGTSLLTPHAADQFLAQVYRFLERMKEQQPKREDDRFPWGDVIEGPDDYTSKGTLDYLIERLANDPPNGLAPETVGQLGIVLKRLKQDDFFCVAQRLSGFNEALLMHRPTLGIPIRHPIGFDEDQTLAANVERALCGETHYAPQARYFSPIRAGELQVKRLRVVSTFGRQLDFQCDRVITSTPMQAQSGRPATVFLPPRLVQPARLQFRWLAAQSDEQEMNAHPDSMPVCGWLIANYLDDNLFFYANDGKVLGYMEVEARARVRWRPAPGAAEPVIRLDQIANDYLRQLVAFFLRGSAEYFKEFLNDLEAAQERIEPEHAGEPLPMGQPLALVRARLSLELQGLPAIQRNWLEPGASQAVRGSDNDRFTGVRFPIRLGEQDQLNDGLAVYFVENEDGSYKDTAYVIPSYQDDAGAQDKKCDFLYQSIDDPPLSVAMLMDPRGAVHASTGILPAKAIAIPPHQYSHAMKRFEMTFLSAPVLAGSRPMTGEDTIALAVTDPPGYKWSWLEKRDGGWIAPSIHAADLFRPFAGTTEIREGWLKLALPKQEKDKK